MQVVLQASRLHACSAGLLVRRCLSSTHGSGRDPTSTSANAEAPLGWWSQIKTILFPVTNAATTETANSTGVATGPHSARQAIASHSRTPRPPPSALLSPAVMQRLQKYKDAEDHQAATADVFTPLSKDAEQFSGNLFKAGMFMISIPLAGYFVSKVLLVSWHIPWTEV